eukprot:g44436.t1
MVPRSDGLLRFIMDARNTNELFLPPMDPNLPGPDCIAQLDLRPSDEVWAATSDISNFYDCFLLPEWMLPFMALQSVFIAVLYLRIRDRLSQKKTKHMATGIAVVGGGVAGQVACRVLVRAGLSVTLFEKSRTCGRIASHSPRSRDDLKAYVWDHGVQYISVKQHASSTWLEQIKQWQARGLLRLWSARLLCSSTVNMHGGAVLSPMSAEKRYVGVPNSQILGESILTVTDLSSIDKKQEVKVQGIIPLKGGDGWEIKGGKEEGANDSLGKFRGVVLAVPSTNAVQLLSPMIKDRSQEEEYMCDIEGESLKNELLVERIKMVEMRPCWTIVLALPEGVVNVKYGGLLIQTRDADFPLAWVANNCSKPGRGVYACRGLSSASAPGIQLWTLQASPQWSEDNLEAEKELVLSQLIDSFAQLTATKPAVLLENIVYSHAHRWRYAMPKRTLTDGVVAIHRHWVSSGQTQLNAGGRKEALLWLCGDWCKGREVEAAFESGLAAGKSVLAALEQNNK